MQIAEIKKEIAEYEENRRALETQLANARKFNNGLGGGIEAQIRYVDEVLPPLRRELQQRVEMEAREAASKKAADAHARDLLDPEKPLAGARQALKPLAAAVEDARTGEKAAVKSLANAERDVSKANERRMLAQEAKRNLSGDERRAQLHKIAALDLEIGDAIEQRDTAKAILNATRDGVAAALKASRQTEADVLFWSAAVISSRARQRAIAFVVEQAADVIEITKLARESDGLVRRPGALFGEGGLTRICAEAGALPEVKNFSHFISLATSTEEVHRIIDDLRGSVKKSAARTSDATAAK